MPGSCDGFSDDDLIDLLVAKSKDSSGMHIGAQARHQRVAPGCNRLQDGRMRRQAKLARTAATSNAPAKDPSVQSRLIFQANFLSKLEPDLGAPAVVAGTAKEGGNGENGSGDGFGATVENAARVSHRETLPESRPRATYQVICGSASDVLKSFKPHSVDMCMTSPPYWGHREYDVPGIGQEPTCEAYVAALCHIFQELKRVLKPEGSLWLNIGDTYEEKGLRGVPWRVALKLMDDGGWILRNDNIWNKVKGAPDNSTDKLRNIHEYVFHFVLKKHYYFDVDAIRSNPKQAKIINGAVISATGVSGVRYRRQIELSTALSPAEKKEALRALNAMLESVRERRIADFRMIIRGQQRTTHSDKIAVSGRAKEIQERGFYFLRYHPNGSKPSDVWDIIPEDTQNRKGHFATYPTDLCRIPILATCPPGGTVIDPFCGTGTTLAVAKALDRRAIGIDVSPAYVDMTRRRLAGVSTEIE